MAASKAAREHSKSQAQPQPQHQHQHQPQPQPQQEPDSECERLLRNTKRQVKQMMEEAIARKFIHEESGSILALCVTVDSCLTHGLRRRALGLFKTSSSTALIKRIAKGCAAASQVLEQVEAELQGPHSSVARAHQLQNSPVLRRNLWIKRALIGKRLVEIVEYLAERACEFYEQEALMCSPLCSQILISLLVGPSALDFSSSKLHGTNYSYSNASFQHHQAAEPSADELMRRHRLANRVACLCGHTESKPAPQPTTTTTTTTSREEEEHYHGPHQEAARGSSTSRRGLLQQQSSQQVPHQRGRRRPLALKKTPTRRGGTLATDCHHYSCQEISEHQPATRGYSLVEGGSPACHGSQQQSSGSGGGGGGEWPLWSPSMLHEMLHQNAKSRLLYAKNNILLEVQARNTDVAGYLSLHETSQSELIMNWIPNQMIKGGTPSTATSPSAPQPHPATPPQATPQQPEASSHQPPKEEREEEEEENNTQPQESVESSYLELVVSLNVSRIVLIQCQFQRSMGHKGNPAAPSSKPLAAPERLMLVEADGVQGAPFKFPKGGLRQFLACLDGGLRPQRRLEPAIWVEEAPRAQLKMKSPSTGCSSEQQVPGSPKSEPDSDSALSSLLKRLPSLRRPPPPRDQMSNNNNNYTCVSLLEGQDQFKDYSATNFVYRIVGSSTQLDKQASSSSTNWSSSSSSPPLLHHTSSLNNSNIGASAKTSATQSPSLPPASSRSEPADTNRFQWSLKRLARLSYKYNSNSSSTCSSTNLPNQSTPTTSQPLDSTPQVAPSQQASDLSSSLDNYLETHQNPPVQSSQPTADIAGHGGGGGGGGGLVVVDDGYEEARDSSRDLAKVEAKLEQIKKSTSEDVLVALRTSSIQALCDSMRKQILARAFYGWLAYCRRARIIRKHLKKLVKEEAEESLLMDDSQHSNADQQLTAGLSMDSWQRLMGAERALSAEDVARQVCLAVYHGGIESDELRHQVWPYLLEYYSFSDLGPQREARDLSARQEYESQGREWIQVERVVKQRDREILAANIARAGKANKMKATTGELQEQPASPEVVVVASGEPEAEAEAHDHHLSEADDSFDEQQQQQQHDDADNQDAAKHAQKPRPPRTEGKRRRYRLESTGSVGSDASITDHFGNNIHRIDKDVQRCDRNFWYFKDPKNLNKLRNIMCTYVWKHLDMGYVQGMCDLAAPLLVIFDDECLAYNCFCQLMKRMVSNFPHGRAMDEHFESLKHLMQIMDPKLFEILESNGDYAHFYFCYRWLLLDFKRELAYEDVYKVWETIWAARFVATDHFVVFMALAMVRYYRDIIIDNNMDFTDTIKFFNEMAERHDTKMILALARDCIVELQYLIKIS